MRSSPLWLVTITCFLGLSNSVCQAQQPEPVPTIQATTRAVILDVVVTGKNNRTVAGLTKDDFVVEEDKTRQTIRSFESVSITAPDRSQPDPETILLVDEMNTRFPDFAYVRYSVKKLLARNGGKLLQPTMLMVLTDYGLKVLAEPTRDGALLESAMQHLPPAIPFRLNNVNPWAGIERINLSVDALHQIATANAGSGSRKNLVWISPGFPAYEPAPGDAIYEKKFFDTIRTLSDQLLKARIAIYTIDPRGVFQDLYEDYLNHQQFQLYFSTLQTQNRVAFQDLALQTLAVQTGGRSLWGRNDVDQEISDSIGDGDTYYTLSYSPVNKNFDGNFRKIKVTLPEHPELHARTRDGYYALPEPPPPTPKSVGEQMNEALTSTLKYKAIPILTTSTSLVSAPARAWLSFTVNADALSWSPISNGQIQTRVDIAVTDFSKKDEVLHVIDRSYVAVLDQTRKPNVERRISFRIAAPVTLPPNRLRLVVRDQASGRMGTADITVFPPVQKQQPSDYLQHRTP